MDFAALAHECAPSVHQQTIAAVVHTESAGNPWAIGVNRANPKHKRPTNKTEAVAEAKRLIEAGYNIDMGLGQINSANLEWLGLTVEQVFDPCTNLQAAAKILTQNYIRAASYGETQDRLKAALSAYNTGHFERGIKNGYVGEVYKMADRTMPTVPAINENAATTKAKPAAKPKENHPTSAGNVFGSHNQRASNVFERGQERGQQTAQHEHTPEDLARAAQLLQLLQTMQQDISSSETQGSKDIDPAEVFPKTHE